MRDWVRPNLRPLSVHYGGHWLRKAEGCGLAARGTLRRVEDVTKRLVSELPAAIEEVAAMPAGRGILLDVFARAIEEVKGTRAHAEAIREQCRAFWKAV